MGAYAWRVGHHRDLSNKQPKMRMTFGSMLGQRHRRWPRIEPASARRLGFGDASQDGQV